MGTTWKIFSVITTLCWAMIPFLSAQELDYSLEIIYSSKNGHLSMQVDPRSSLGKYETRHYEGGIRIMEKDTRAVLMAHCCTAGSATIQKMNEAHFVIHGFAAIPLGEEDTYVRVQIFRADLIIEKDSIWIEPTCDFAGIPHMFPGQFASIISKYQTMASDQRFTNKNWDAIEQADMYQVLLLSYKLMIAVLNGCEVCVPLFEEMRDTFDIINAGDYSEQHEGNTWILHNYGYLKNNK